MTQTHSSADLRARVHDFVRRDFAPKFGQLTEAFGSDPRWVRMRELGTELWLDTGSIPDASALWTREFTALTTNNTLLNREVQKGTYDALIPRAGELLGDYELSARQRMLEIAFILNARHGLKLVETFDAMVSVEEHTDLGFSVSGAVDYARRYHAICPERFIVKIPLTPAGLLATRIVAREGIPVNHTLGFSARQNYVIARIARPAYVNVFLGRLNSLVAGNGLGDGQGVGEKATLASQQALRDLRQSAGVPTRQIGASFRAGEQVRDLAGLDVMTVPPAVARGLLDLGLAPEDLADRTGERYEPTYEEGADPGAAGLGSLWEIGGDLVACLDALEQEDLDAFTPDDLVGFFAAHDCADVLPAWTGEQIATAAADGKIVVLDHWREPLASGAVGLDAVMNLSGLHSFIADQKEMDDRIEENLR